ncbi:MAG: DUF421 domain-containing protein [Bacilli bacterium]
MYLTLIYKTIFLYFFIIVVYRVMGKKEVGKLSVVDLIVSVLIAELVALSIESPDNSIFLSIIPIITLVCIQLGLGYITLKNNSIREVVDGKPTVIIKNGKLDFKEMTKLRYSLDDLIMQLREQGFKSIEEVNYAILENDGKLSVFDHSGDYPIPIILDGCINQDVLKEIKKDENWLSTILFNKNIALEDVFYAFYTNNKTFIIKKSDLIMKNVNIK